MRRLGAASYGRAGHISCILLKETAKVPARIINFPGAAEVINALVLCNVDLILATTTSAKPMVDSGDFRALLVLDDRSDYPGVPSLPQIGYPELTNLGQHRMIITPPNLPPAVTGTLIAVFKRVFHDKEFLALAGKIDCDVNPLFGRDADTVVRKLAKYYEDMTPLLKRHLTMQ